MPRVRAPIIATNQRVSKRPMLIITDHSCSIHDHKTTLCPWQRDAEPCSSKSSLVTAAKSSVSGAPRTRAVEMWLILWQLLDVEEQKRVSVRV